MLCSAWQETDGLAIITVNGVVMGTEIRIIALVAWAMISLSSLHYT